MNQTNIKTYIGKIGFFQVACSLGILAWGVGSIPPNVMAN
jgi:hypothetical protein